MLAIGGCKTSVHVDGLIWVSYYGNSYTNVEMWHRKGIVIPFLLQRSLFTEVFLRITDTVVVSVPYKKGRVYT